MVGKLVVVAAVVAVVWGGELGEGECPCALLPASSGYPGGEVGKLQWDCNGRLLTQVPTACWAINPNVTQVDLFNNFIPVLRDGDFDGLWDLRYLSTFKGSLTTVEAGSLRDLTRLQYLDLGFSYLTEVPDEVSYLSTLETLALEYNQITEVPVGRILPLVNLEMLILVRNHIELIPELQFLPKLTWLNLEANNLRSLPRNLLSPALTAPCQLWINDNPLTDIAAATLLPLPPGSDLRTNASLWVWATNETEKVQLLDNEWRVYDKNQNDLELAAMTHTCDAETYDPPTDFVHPCEP